jgi:hypothetical protein
MASLRARRHLLASVTQRQSRTARKTVEAAVEAVVSEARPLFFSSPKRDDGVWRLLWSSQTADANPWAMPSSVLGGQCVQRIASKERLVQNIVRWGRSGKDSIELVGSASVNVQRVGRRLRRSVTITGLDVLRDGVRALTLFDLRGLVDSQQSGDSGFLEDVYNDGVLRISRANNGFTYIYQRELRRVWAHGARS